LGKRPKERAEDRFQNISCYGDVEGEQILMRVIEGKKKNSIYCTPMMYEALC
jgi:hypothetical protein